MTTKNRRVSSKKIQISKHFHLSSMLSQHPNIFMCDYISISILCMKNQVFMRYLRFFINYCHV